MMLGMRTAPRQAGQADHRAQVDADRLFGSPLAFSRMAAPSTMVTPK